MQATNIGDVHIIIIPISTKEVYNGKVKLFNTIEPFRLPYSIFHSIPAFSHVLIIPCAARTVHMYLYLAINIAFSYPAF